jgi:hypothetical protein
VDFDMHSNDETAIPPHSCNQLADPLPEMSDREILGVIVLARNGDRLEYYQDPKTYAGSFTATTPLGEVGLFLVGHSKIN